MKKALAILLAVLLSLSVIALVACDKNKITKITVDGLPDEVELNDIDFYKNITITITYEDNTTETLAYNSDGVKLEGTDTSTKGAKIFKVLYGGLSAEKSYTVIGASTVDKVITVTSINNTEGYRDYKANIENQTNAEEIFYDTKRGYSVGTANGYWCLPEVTYIDENGNVGTLDNPITTFRLLENDEPVADVAQYVSAVDNIYYFTEAAIGRTFKLEIALGEQYELFDEEGTKIITQTITIVDGYNVHDVLDLSVLDNLNNNSWSNIKTAVRLWNNGRTLAEFKDIKQIIIHNNITVTKDNLPSNYFWQADETAVEGTEGKSYADAFALTPEKYQNLLVGSIKETCLGEDWETGDHKNQRGLFCNNGIGVNGNYLKLSYESGLVVAENGTVTAPNGGIYVVYDYNQEGGTKSRDYPECHTSFVAVRNDGSDSYNSPTFENIYFVGQTRHTNDITSPAGLMMIGGIEVDSTIDNVIANQWFCNIEIDGNDSEDPHTVVDMKNCKFYDAFSQMVYSWYGKGINVTNCELKRAGGPLFILECATDEATNPVATTLNIDSTANMESWLTGSEAWFTINLEESAVIAVSHMISTATILDGETFGRTYAQKEGEMLRGNIIAVLIPSPGDLPTNQNKVYGELYIMSGQDDDTSCVTQGLNESMFRDIVALSSPAAEAATLAKTLFENYSEILNESQKVQFEALIKGFNALALINQAPIFASNGQYAYTDGENAYSLANLVKSVKQLYGGVQSIVELLGTLAANQAETEKAVTNAIIEQWNAIAAKLAPMATLEVNDGWKTNDCGYMTMYVNSSQFKVDGSEYFAVLFGENQSK